MDKMKIIEKDARFTISCHFTLSQTDDEVLTLLYIPLITGTGYSLYHYLFSLVPVVRRKGYLFFEEMEEFLGLKGANILEGFSLLEGIGLVSTYRRESINDGKSTIQYLFRLFPPASPRKFFSDIILKSLLEQKVGEKRLQELGFLFQDSDELPKGFIDVSSRLADSFSLTEVSQMQAEEPIEDKNYRNVSTFDQKRFLSLLHEARIDKACKREMKEIVDLAILYGVKETDACEIVEKNIDSTQKFHLDSYREDIRSFSQYQPLDFQGKRESYQNRLLGILSSLTPKKYLSYRLNAEPPSFMLEEIEKLSRETKLENPVINVVLDYSLRKTDGKFTPLYIEKIAYSLLSENIHSPYDAMVYLNSQDVGKKAALNRKRRRKTMTAESEKKEDSALEDKILRASERKVKL